MDEIVDLRDEFEDQFADELDGPEDCPACGRQYDEIDSEYLICSKCGFNAEDRTFGKPRQPKDIDYMSGDADILTGTWY